jgi:diaminobutyrate-2-oxoglutarate transaminase
LITRHVPWTRLLEPGPTTDPDGHRHELFDYVLRNRTRLVLKPANLTRGAGVHIGAFSNEGDWADVLRTAAGSRYVVQEYAPLPVVRELVDDGTRTETRYLDLSCYVVDGKLAGFLSRSSIGPVVNMGGGGACVPVIQFDRRSVPG